MAPRARFDPFPKLPPPLQQICRITAGPPVAYQILSHRLSPMWTHFVRTGPHTGRSYPCTSEHADRCIWDHATSRVCFNGWLAVQPIYGRVLMYLNMTLAAVRANPLLLDPEVDLRGRQITVARKTSGMMLVGITDSPGDLRKLLKGGNMLNFLKNLYGLPASWPVDPKRFAACEIDPAEFWSDFCGDGGDM